MEASESELETVSEPQLDRSPELTNVEMTRSTSDKLDGTK